MPAELEAEWRRADEQVFAPVRALLGPRPGRVAFAVGAAPTPPEVIEFFLAMGIEICELWGMSETSSAATVNPPGRVRVGTVRAAAAGGRGAARRGRRGDGARARS